MKGYARWFSYVFVAPSEATKLHETVKPDGCCRLSSIGVDGCWQIPWRWVLTPSHRLLFHPVGKSCCPQTGGFGIECMIQIWTSQWLFLELQGNKKMIAKGNRCFPAKGPWHEPKWNTALTEKHNVSTGVIMLLTQTMPYSFREIP